MTRVTKSHNRRQKKDGLLWWGFLIVCLATLCLNVSLYAQETGQDSSKASPETAPDDFEPLPDRWRDIQPPPYELNVDGHWYDPYNRNILKGDYPIIGDDVFFILTASTQSFGEFNAVPTPSAISTARPLSQGFFGREERFFVQENLKLTFELYKGNTAFKPRDVEIKVTPVFNLNYINTRENNDVNINVRKGANRMDEHVAFQELFLEKHLFDISDRYDFISTKLGIQFFKSDFRGFIFDDFNLGARLLGSAANNKYQYSLAYFRMLEKDTNSELNTIFEDREQDVFVANLYKQDFITLGYTTQFSVHYNHDKESVHFDENGIPVRPAVLGNVRPHDIKALYLGWTSDGHFGRLNVNHAFYQVLGKDSFNSLAGRKLDINAQMAALELSVDKDWQRYRISAFYASGDPDPSDGAGRGFDTILDLPFFAGGPFSYWNTQKIRLLGINLTQKLSLVPNLRSSKIEGQANFVNPGLLLFNVGYDAELTPKLKAVLNANYLRFASTASLEEFTNQNGIANNIGLDYGLGLIYRPFLNNNAIFTFSATALTPFGGFKDLFESATTQFALLTQVIFTY